MKQTAVEWLENQFQEAFKDFGGLDTNYIKRFEQAKQIEKEQIFECWDNGFDNGNFYGKYNENCEITCGEQYYNETFKSE